MQSNQHFFTKQSFKPNILQRENRDGPSHGYGRTIPEYRDRFYLIQVKFS